MTFELASTTFLTLSSSITMTEPLFLGLDLSTQQLKALLIDEKAAVVYDFTVGYDKDLPHYGTTNGAIHGPSDSQVTSPVAMWIEALDLILQRMRNAGIDFSQIRAVSGAGQVCLSHTFLYMILSLLLRYGSNTALSIGQALQQMLSLPWILQSRCSRNLVQTHSLSTTHPFGKTPPRHWNAGNWRRSSVDPKHWPTSRAAVHTNVSQGHRLRRYVVVSTHVHQIYARLVSRFEKRDPMTIGQPLEFHLSPRSFLLFFLAPLLLSRLQMQVA